MTNIMLSDGIVELSRIFRTAGYTLYLVGGTVRNITLGLPEGDFDVCSTAMPDEAAKILREAGLLVIEKALSLGTIEVHLRLNGKKYIFEHTTFRRDYYPEGGEHRPYKVEFTNDINQDAKRRDFTINTLYMNIETTEIIDPTGRGMDDAKNKVLRAAASNPNLTIRDDGLRIMRMARLAAELNFDVDQDLLRCAQKNAHLLSDISAERKWSELCKILMADTKYELDRKNYPAQEHGLSILQDIGALSYVLPRLSEGKGIQQAKQYHRYDVLGHCIKTCAATPPILPLRIAALLHDIGKPEAIMQNSNMYGHDKLGEKIAREELKALKADNKTISTVLPLVRHHMFDLEGKARPKTIRKYAIKLGKQLFEMLIELRRADYIGSGMVHDKVVSAEHWQTELIRMLEQNVPWTVKDLVISGKDIIEVLGVEPSPSIGVILDVLFRECINHPAVNQRELLLKRAAKLFNE